MQHPLHKGLRFRLWFYFLLCLAELGLTLTHVIIDGVFVVFPLAGLGIGIWLGMLISKAFHISWDEEAEQVVTRWDTFGVIILIASGVIELYKEPLVGYFVNASAVVAVSFAVVSGIMFGRMAGLSERAAHVIHENS